MLGLVLGVDGKAVFLPPILVKTIRWLFRCLTLPYTLHLLSG